MQYNMWIFSKAEDVTPFGILKAYKFRLRRSGDVVVLIEDPHISFMYIPRIRTYAVIRDTSPCFTLYMRDGIAALRYMYTDYLVVDGAVVDCEQYISDLMCHLIQIAWWLLSTPNTFKDFDKQLSGIIPKKVRCIAK